jgi:riboflavin biosynthesis pyrimidine reductase
MSDWDVRFARFAERKTQAALDVPLSPFTTEYDRAGLTRLPIGSDWTRARFDGPFYIAPIGRPATNDDRPATNDQRPSTSLVFVQSRDGNTGAKDPSVLGGGDTDKHLIYEGLSRVAADAVLSGTGTVGGSDLVLSVWHPEIVALRGALGLPRHPVQIVASLGGVDLETRLMFNLPELPVVVISSRDGEAMMRAGLRARPWIQCIVTNGAGGLVQAFRAVRARGIQRISAIGGRTMATALLDAGLVDDLYLTTSPKIAGEPGTPLYRGQLRGEAILRKHGTGADDGVVFEHLVI